MIDTGIVLVDGSTKWGLVTVMDKDANIVREYEITAAEADAVRYGGSAPPGCTKDEWESGLVMVATRPCLPGQAFRNPDGTLVVNYGKEERGGKISVHLMQLAPAEWEISGEKVRMPASIAKQVDSSARGV